MTWPLLDTRTRARIACAMSAHIARVPRLPGGVPTVPDDETPELDDEFDDLDFPDDYPCPRCGADAGEPCHPQCPHRHRRGA